MLPKRVNFPVHTGLFYSLFTFGAVRLKVRETCCVSTLGQAYVRVKEKLGLSQV